MKREKVPKLLAIILMLLPMFLGALFTGNGSSQAAESETVDVTLHKRAFKDKMPVDIKNTGELMPDFEGTPLNGVGFTVYDVTKEYYDLLDEKDSEGKKVHTSDSAIDYIQRNAVIFTKDNERGSGTTSGVDDDENPLGQVTFEKLPLKISGRDAVYLFLETFVPIEVQEKATPIVLAMPIYTIEITERPATLNTDIHLYPKNVTKKNEKMMAGSGYYDKVMIGEGANEREVYGVRIGNAIRFTIVLHIPTHINEVTDFFVEDKPSAGLKYIPRSIEVNGMSQGTDYHLLPTTGNGFRIRFSSSGKILSYAGRGILIEYSMELTENAKIDDVHFNNAVVSFDRITQELKGPELVTGGHQFIKTDSHTGEGLEGAKFKVQDDSTGKYAIFTLNGNNDYSLAGWTTNDEDVRSEIQSGADGTFNVIGLIYDTYNLIETEAPSDKYVKLTESVPFTVKFGEYKTSILSGEVANTPKGLLPATGGNGILAFLAIGLGLMLGAFVWYKREKQTND